jgi:hypothetical protein
VSKVTTVVLNPVVSPWVKYGLPVSPLAYRCSIVARAANVHVAVLLADDVT